MSILPYEQLGLGRQAARICDDADRIITSGWTRSSYPTIAPHDKFPWSTSDAQLRSWAFHMHGWDMLDAVLAAHCATLDPVYLEYALRVATDWVTQHPTVDQSQSSPFAWYDMAVGLRAYRLAYLLDVVECQSDIPLRIVEQLRQSLQEHRVHLQDDSKIAFHNNHGFYQVFGQLAMARRFLGRLDGMDAAYEQGVARFHRMLRQQFTDEGVHREHSPDYHRMVYLSLKGIIDAGLVTEPQIVDFAQRIENSLAWFVQPNGRLVQFGDSDHRSLVSPDDCVSTRWQSDAMRWIASGATLGTPPNEEVAAFTDAGYFIVRSPWGSGRPTSQDSYLAQTLGFHSRTHKHADDLSICWYEKGCEILIDSGRYGYLGRVEPGSALSQEGHWYADPNRIYCESTRAHNTVEMDALSRPRQGIEPYGSALRRWTRAGQGIVICASACPINPSIEHSRTLIYKPGEWLLVHDLTSDDSEAEHDFRQWFHFAPDIQVERLSEGFLATRQGESWRLMVRSFIHAEVEGPISGQHEPSMQGWWSPSERTMVASPAIAYRMRGHRAEFATLFTFADQLSMVSRTASTRPDECMTHFSWITNTTHHNLYVSTEPGTALEAGYSATPVE